MLLRRRVAILAIGLFAFLFLTAFVSSPTDFSGSYLEDPRDLKKPAADERLTIQQTDASIEITHTWNGKTRVEAFPLDGTEVSFQTSAGTAGKGSAKWHGRELVIEKVLTPSPVNGKVTRIYSKAHWRLSKDGKTLTISTETGGADINPHYVSGAVQPSYYASPMAFMENFKRIP